MTDESFGFLKLLSNCPLLVLPFAVGGQDEERSQQGLGEQPGWGGGQPARPRGGRARTDGHQRRLHPQVRGGAGGLRIETPEVRGCKTETGTRVRLFVAILAISDSS